MQAQLYNTAKPLQRKIVDKSGFSYIIVRCLMRLPGLMPGVFFSRGCTMNPLHKRVVAFTTMAHALTHSFMLVFPTLQGLVEKDFGVKQAAFYSVYFWSRLFFGSGSITAGVLADRFGSKKVLLLFLFGAGVSSILVAGAGGQTSLLIGLCLLGYFCSLYHTAGIKLVTKREGNRGATLAYHGTGGNLGLALSPAISACIAYSFGWAGAYYFFGALSLIVALVLLFAHIEVRHQEDGEIQMPNAEHVDKKPLMIFLVPYCLLGFAYTGFITFMPSFVKSVLDFPERQATLISGAIMTGCYLIGSLGQFYGGKRADRGLLERHWLTLLLLVLPFFILLSIAGRWLIVLVISGIAFPFLFFATQPVSNSMLAKYSSYEWRGRILSIGFFCSFGLGSVATIAGKPLAQAGRFNRIFLMLSMATLAAIAVSGLLLRLASRRNESSNRQA